MESTKEFIHSVAYAGESANYLDARVTIQIKLKCKTSMAIPPDTDLVEHAIKTTHLKKFTWLHFCKQNINELNPVVTQKAVLLKKPSSRKNCFKVHQNKTTYQGKENGI